MFTRSHMIWANMAFQKPRRQVNSGWLFFSGSESVSVSGADFFPVLVFGNGQKFWYICGERGRWGMGRSTSGKAVGWCCWQRWQVRKCQSSAWWLPEWLILILALHPSSFTGLCMALCVNHPQRRSADCIRICWFVHACFSHIPDHHPLSYSTTLQPTRRPVCVQSARCLRPPCA